MLFKSTFKPPIRDGQVTITFRTWKTAKAKVGNSYRLGPADAVVVESVEQVPYGSITPSQARRAGFDDVEALQRMLAASAKEPLTPRSRVFRVRFRYERQADQRTAQRADTSAGALDEVATSLARMDRLGRRGAWTINALRLIDRYPNVAASKLAPRMHRETAAFKTDIRKLKELGLTVSHEVGYSLSSRGRAFLRRIRLRTT